ncbi:MAG: helix-turn-helix transcriptional regulator [Liquorilactobacillus hordei]|uniref:helix-turn-helix domain-containing protein n=1 Tax=Liquorilactobacillus hordei TaxID=468911 RepID=UPI0039E8E551
MWNKIENILNKKNMSINELSTKIYSQKRNMTLYALKKGEISKPSFDLVCKIADALEVDLNYFRD